METFKEYVQRNLRNVGFGWLDGCRTLHITPARFKNPEALSIKELKVIRDTLDIPDREMERKILEIFRYGDLESGY